MKLTELHDIMPVKVYSRAFNRALKAWYEWLKTQPIEVEGIRVLVLSRSLVIEITYVERGLLRRAGAIGAKLKQELGAQDLDLPALVRDFKESGTEKVFGIHFKWTKKIDLDKSVSDGLARPFFFGGAYISEAHDIEDILPPKAFSYALGQVIGRVMKRQQPSWVTIFPDQLATVEFRAGDGQSSSYQEAFSSEMTLADLSQKFRFGMGAHNAEMLYSFTLYAYDHDLDEDMIRKGIRSIDPSFIKRIYFM